jgi:hypothetical protein
MIFCAVKRPLATAVTASLLLAGMPFVALAEPYQPPPGIGLPGPREGAGTRGCIFRNPESPETPAAVIALMPENNVGWTTEAYPQFHWYLPLNLAAFVEVTVFQVAEDVSPETNFKTINDDTTSGVYVLHQSRFAVTGDAGIASLQLPSNASLPPLEVGQRYYWQVQLFCDTESTVGELAVGGWIERREPSEALALELAQASASDRIGLYASNGYWFNAVDGLIALQTQDSEDATAIARWQELLDSVGLLPIADQAFLGQ